MSSAVRCSSRSSRSFIAHNLTGCRTDGKAASAVKPNQLAQSAQSNSACCSTVCVAFSCLSGGQVSRVWLFLELALEDFADHARVRLAFAQLHYLAFEEIERGGFAVPEVRCRTGIGGEDLLAKLLDRARVAHLGQAFLLNNGGGRFARGEHLGKHLLGGGSADGLVVHQFDQFENVFGFEPKIVERLKLRG